MKGIGNTGHVHGKQEFDSAHESAEYHSHNRVSFDFVRSSDFYFIFVLVAYMNYIDNRSNFL